MFVIAMTSRKMVACAAAENWPRNDIPLFKNNPKNWKNWIY